MTTASFVRGSDAEFGYGSGLVNLRKAIAPVLVYDMGPACYDGFLCNEGYKDLTVAIIVGDSNVNCSAPRFDYGVDGFNCPLLHHTAKSRVEETLAVKVRNVGPVRSTYPVLVLDDKNKERTFTVELSEDPPADHQMLSASLTWVDGRHRVRSPIVVAQNV